MSINVLYMPEIQILHVIINVSPFQFQVFEICFIVRVGMVVMAQ